MIYIDFVLIFIDFIDLFWFSIDFLLIFIDFIDFEWPESELRTESGIKQRFKYI